MKVRWEVDLDMDSGEYSSKFWNLSHPGESIEYNEVQNMLKKVFSDIDESVVNADEDDEKVFKVVH